MKVIQEFLREVSVAYQRLTSYMMTRKNLLIQKTNTKDPKKLEIINKQLNNVNQQIQLLQHKK